MSNKATRRYGRRCIDSKGHGYYLGQTYDRHTTAGKIWLEDDATNSTKLRWRHIADIDNALNAALVANFYS